MLTAGMKQLTNFFANFFMCFDFTLPPLAAPGYLQGCPLIIAAKETSLLQTLMC